jgi:[ribosomal protein S5]-alanine N-acetyltransferase
MFNVAPFLETKRLFLSPIDENNIDEYYIFLNNEKNDIYTEHAEFPHTKEDIRKYVKNKKQSKASIFLGIYLKDNKTHIGNIELCNINFTHGTSEYKILIDSNYHRNGYATEASKKLFEHAFQKLNLYKISLGVSELNISALSLYNSLGFKKEGILVGQIHRDNERVNIINMSIFSNRFK